MKTEASMIAEAKLGDNAVEEINSEAGSLRSEFTPPAIILALTAVLTIIAFFSSDSTSHILVMTLIWASAATAWNIVGGFAGQISLGHAAFFGVGAYANAILFVNYGVSPWIGMIVGMVAGGVLSLLIGIPAFRLRGPYFALATLAAGMIMFYLSVELQDLTRGHVGMPIPYEPGLANMIFENRWSYVVLAGAFLALCVFVSAYILRRKLGYQLAAVRDDEDAARALGVNAMRVKLIAATVSGVLVGGLGTIYGQYILYVSPNSAFGIEFSIEVLALAVVGGAGFIYGPLVGAALLVPLSNLILDQFGGGVPGLHTLIYGIVLILVVLFAPKGLWGFIQQGIDRWRLRKSRDGTSRKPAPKTPPGGPTLATNEHEEDSHG